MTRIPLEGFSWILICIFQKSVEEIQDLLKCEKNNEYFTLRPIRFFDRISLSYCWNYIYLTLILLTWRIWWAPNKASKWQMGFKSAFKGLKKELQREPKHNFHIQYFFFRKSFRLWDNVEEYVETDRPQMTMQYRTFALRAGHLRLQTRTQNT
jgi:hypothetical protein